MCYHPMDDAVLKNEISLALLAVFA